MVSGVFKGAELKNGLLTSAQTTPLLCCGLSSLQGKLKSSGRLIFLQKYASVCECDKHH